MISRHARFERRKARRFADVVDAVNRPAAITDIHPAFVVKGDAGGDAEIMSKGFGFLEWRDAVDRAVETAGDEHLAVGAEGQAGRVDDVGQERLALAIGRDLVDRDRHLLAARS